MIAAERLWKVAPEAAQRVLDSTPADQERASLRSLIRSAPVERTGAVARAILSRRGILSTSELADWARSRLSTAGAHAEAVGRILDLDVGNQASAGT